MPPRTDRRLDAARRLPCLAAGRCLAHRLTAAFFDPNVREPILRELRDAIAALQPPLPNDQRQPFQDIVVAALCTDASRRAVPPQPEPTPAPPLTGHTLAQQVVHHYPYPIARPYFALNQATPGPGPSPTVHLALGMRSPCQYRVRRCSLKTVGISFGLPPADFAMSMQA